MNTLKFFIAFLASFICLQQSRAQNFSADSLKAYAEQQLSDYSVPALAIAIVDKDSLLFSQGFGLNNIEKDQAANSETLFGIGSISKSFTALAVGMLVSDGKMDWDDKVKKYLPYFELYDPYVSDNFTIRDLLTHRSGLKDVSGGSLWYHSDFSRKEIIKRMKYLKPVSGFREKTAYQNIMYLVAGEVVAAVSGMTYDAFIKSRIFDPLNMKHTVSLAADREGSQNIARPHIDYEGKKILIVQEKGDNLAAGGFIYSSANDMARYMRFMLNKGIVGKDTLIHAREMSEILKPQVIYQISGPPLQNEFSSYGFGWWLTPKDGHKIVEHSGGIDGMSANLVMISDLNYGVIVLSNTSSPASFVITTNLIGKKLGNDEMVKFSNIIKMYYDRNLVREEELKQKRKDSQIKNTQMSLEAEKYTGTYRDKMYGDVYVSLENKELQLRFSHTPLFSGKLEHWHYDTFNMNWSDPRVPDGFITFVLGSDGEVSELKIDQENLLDVDFSEISLKKVQE